jgi:hypothetical protein
MPSVALPRGPDGRAPFRELRHSVAFGRTNRRATGCHMGAVNNDKKRTD